MVFMKKKMIYYGLLLQLIKYSKNIHKNTVNIEQQIKYAVKNKLNEIQKTQLERKRRITKIDTKKKNN